MHRKVTAQGISDIHVDINCMLYSRRPLHGGENSARLAAEQEQANVELELETYSSPEEFWRVMRKLSILFISQRSKGPKKLS